MYKIGIVGIGPQRFDFVRIQWFKRSVDKSFFEQFSQAHLLVAGEVGIDEYIWGDSRRISPEAPVPVVEVERQDCKLGLGANVAQNITSLGAKVSLVSVCGEDQDRKQLETMLGEAGIKTANLISDPTRPTLRKVRVIAQRQHVVRIDYEKSHKLDAKLAKKFSENICDLLPKTDGMILQDYGKGLWNADTMAFVKHAKQHKKPVFVDPSRLSPASLYKGTSFLTPNVVEAEILAGSPPHPHRSIAGKDDEWLSNLGKKILADTEAQTVIITCGEWGMVAVNRDEKELTRIPTFARDVFDVTGAGDTVVAVLALTNVLGHPLARCMQVANAAAGLVVARIGTASVTIAELQTEIERLTKSGLLS